MRKIKFLAIIFPSLVSLPVLAHADGADTGEMMSGSWGNMMNMMGMGNMTGGSWLVSLLYLVWLIVGILAIIWLWQQITKK